MTRLGGLRPTTGGSTLRFFVTGGAALALSSWRLSVKKALGLWMREGNRW
jgi:hypothetical protein